MSNFTLAFKSTIDKLAHDLAASKSMDLIDLDDLVSAEALFKSDSTAMVWEFLTLDEAPVDPLYSFSFRLGARTIRDANNYNILGLVGDIQSVFTAGQVVPVRDYSGGVAGPDQGVMTIVHTGVDPQQFDKQTGLRMVVVSGRCHKT